MASLDGGPAPEFATLSQADIDVLQLMLAFEHLESAFYQQALDTFSADDFDDTSVRTSLWEDLQFVARDDSTHVRFWEYVLKVNKVTPVAAPSFSFPFNDVYCTPRETRLCNSDPFLVSPSSSSLRSSKASAHPATSEPHLACPRPREDSRTFSQRLLYSPRRLCTHLCSGLQQRRPQAARRLERRWIRHRCTLSSGNSSARALPRTSRYLGHPTRL